MVQTISTKDIDLRFLIDNFGIQLVTDEGFFREWQDDLPEITDLERQLLDKVKAGLGQILAYMLANPQIEKPTFGIITTGSEFVFIKLIRGETLLYGLSKIFLVRNPGNELYTVLAILKRLSQLALT